VVKLDFYGSTDQGTVSKKITKVNPRLAQWYNEQIANYSHLNIPVEYSTDEFQIKYLICATPAASAIIQPFVNFKNAQGYGVEVRMLGPGFQTALEIRDYIHQLYVSDGLEYVLMVGDYCTANGQTVMPMYYWSNTWSDSWYTMIDPWPNTGNDYLADLAIGRIVYDNTNQLQLQMNKLMGYLTAPSTADNWAEHSLLVAHQEQYPLKYTQCKEEIRTFPYSIQVPIFQQGYGGAGYTNAQVVSYLNTYSSGILNYRGHGSTLEWWQWGPSGSFTATHIAQLTNANKLFVHYDVCCDNMNFITYNGDCLAESFMKSPVAAVAINGAIIPSYTIPNHDYDKEFYKAIFNNGINNIGYASNYANITVYNVHGTIGQSNIRTYLWLGDASIDPWTKQPQALTVTLPPFVNTGATSLNVTVRMGTNNVNNAMICAQNAQTYTVGYTNISGVATLTFDQALTQNDTLEIMVTAHNGLPYEASLPVASPTGPYVAYQSMTVLDPAGNNNGRLDPGETANFNITVQNYGLALAQNVNMVLSTINTGITIPNNTVTLASLASQAINTSTYSNISAATTIVPGTEVEFFLNITANGGYAHLDSFSIPVGCPVAIDLVPAITPIVIPATGGSFNFTVNITNVGVGAQTFTAWLTATLPAGTSIDLLVRPNLTLNPGATLIRNMSQNVPASAPAGNYTYTGSVGSYPNDPINSDSFPFSKAGIDISGKNGYNNWALTGWEDADATAVAALPTGFALNQNYPNPFNPETTIDFSLPDNSLVDLSIYDTLGRQVATLLEGSVEAGFYSVKWNARDLPSGVYFYRLQAGDHSTMKKCLLLK
jgi:hypothetical protein